MPSILSNVHSHITLPTAQNLLVGAISTLLGGGVVALFQLTLGFAGGCPHSVASDVVKAETELLRGQHIRAKSIASDAVTLAPSCSCTNLTMAMVYATELKSLRPEAVPETRERVRSLCYRYAIKAQGWFGNPRAIALIIYCKAPYV